MNDYSQNGETHIIAQYFNRIGTVCEIGSNDGKTLSNSLALIEVGWSAILIEPSPVAFPLLENLHAKNIHVQCFNVAITEEDGSFDFYDSGTHLNNGDNALLSTLSRQEVQKWKKSGATYNHCRVNGLCWNSFVAQNDISKFDFLSIDAEGFDLKILQQIDFDQHETTAICVEWQGQNKPAFDRVVKKYGFDLAHQNFENLIYFRP